MEKINLLIENACILTMDGKNTRFEKGFLGVKGTKIAAIGSMESLGNLEAEEKIDARGAILMPGLINAHTHISMTLFRGIADDLPLMTWLQDHIFPAEAKLNGAYAALGAELACLEMIASGTTGFCDMYLFTDHIAEVVGKAGMRALLGEAFYNFPSPCYGPIEEGFKFVENLSDQYQNHPRIDIGIAPHSPYLCAPELLQKAFEMARSRNLVLNIHLSETKSEVEQLLQQTGKTPAAFLADLGVLSPKTLAAHCVVMDEEDIRLVAESGTSIAHNAQSNMKLASGIAPVPDFLEAGIPVGLGTDGAASNNTLNMFSEMKTAALLHKVARLDPTLLPANEVLRMATIGGARCLGIADKTGSLEIGKEADCILIETRAPHMTPMYNPESHVVYAAEGSDVSHVLVAGKILYRNREFTGLDAERICARVRETVDKIWR